MYYKTNGIFKKIKNFNFWDKTSGPTPSHSHSLMSFLGRTCCRNHPLTLTHPPLAAHREDTRECECEGAAGLACPPLLVAAPGSG